MYSFSRHVIQIFLFVPSTTSVFIKEHTVCFLIQILWKHETECSCVLYHLGVRSYEAGILRRHTAVDAAEGLWGRQTQRLTAGEGCGGQPPLPRPTAVIGNAKGTAFVVIQSTACRGRQWEGKKKMNTWLAYIHRHAYAHIRWKWAS